MDHDLIEVEVEDILINYVIFLTLIFFLDDLKVEVKEVSNQSNSSIWKQSESTIEPSRA